MLFRFSSFLLAWFWACPLIVASDQRLRGLSALVAAAREGDGHVKTPSYTDLVKKGYGVMVSVPKKAPFIL